MRLERADRDARGGLRLSPVRPATEADLDEVWALNRQAFAEAWTREALSRALAEGFDIRVWRAASGELVAYWMSRDVADETHIMQLAVAPARRRRGLGRQLAQRVLAEKRRGGIRTAWLEVRAGNRAARALYGALGFEEAGVRRGYYTPAAEGAPREDAIVMRLDMREGDDQPCG